MLLLETEDLLAGILHLLLLHLKALLEGFLFLLHLTVLFAQVLVAFLQLLQTAPGEIELPLGLDQSGGEGPIPFIEILGIPPDVFALLLKLRRHLLESNFFG